MQWRQLDFQRQGPGLPCRRARKIWPFEQLAISAQDPVGVDYGDLKLNPMWDPLRGDPRFEKIVASLAPKAADK